MKNLIILIISLLLPAGAYSQEPGWQWLNPKPQGNGVSSMYFTSDMVGYAATWSNCVMKTTDGGISWELKYIPAEISLKEVQFLNSQTGYISTTTNKLCKTTNAGENWVVIDALRPDVKFRNIFFNDPNTGYCTYDSLYLVKSFAGKTTDGGFTWNEIKSDTSVRGYFISSNGAKIFLASTRYSNSNYSTPLYVSSNGGDNWVLNSNFSKGIGKISFSSQDTGYIYLSREGINEIHKTINAGSNWNIIDQNRSSSGFQVIDNENLVQASLGYDGFIHYSSNAGITWQSNSIPNGPFFLYNTPLYNYFYFKNENNGFVTGPNMIRTTNKGSNWLDDYPDNIYGHLTGLDFIDENTGYVSSSNLKTYKTTNGGSSWELTLSHTESFEDIQIVNNTTVYMGSHWGTFARTTDSGASWDTIPTNMSFTAIDFLNENTGYATGKYGPVRKTTNGGLNWTYLTGVYSQSWDIDFINLNTGLVASGGAFKRTSNGGMTWDSIGVSLDTYVYQMKFINENEVLAGTIGNWNQDNHILKSTNGGINWFIAYIAEVSVGEIEVKGNVAYAIGYDSNKLFKSTDRGNTWRTYNTISYREGNRVKFINENTGFIAGWGSTIIKTTNGGFDPIGIEPISAEIPDKFLLHQNYPNPFNPATKIKFDLPKAGLVSLKIYNLLGQQVSELVNQNLNSGVYEYSFDGAGLTSGVYFYRLEAGGVIETKRMMLVK